MENLSLFDIFLVCFCIGFLYNQWKFGQRNTLVKETNVQEPKKKAECAVEYDSQDPSCRMVYLYDRQTQKFLTQAETIRAAVSNLVDQGYTEITFHPEHCPKEIFDSIRFYTPKNANIKL